MSGVWIAVDSNSDVVVQANTIRASDSTPTGWLTLKYDTNGNLLWTRSLPGPFTGSVRVELDAADNIYVAGFSFNDAMVIKYSPSGATLWTRVFDNNCAIDKAAALVVSPNNSRIGVAGMSGNLFLALMYGADGNLLWSNTNTNLYASGDLAFGPDNSSYFATGTYSPSDPNPYQMALARFDAAGNLTWVKSYSVGDKTFRVRVDAQGNVVATGMDQVGYMDWMTIKTDGDGNLLWSRRYDGGRNNDEIANMLLLDASGAVYVTGTGGPNPSSGTVSYLKGVIAKYSPEGVPQWTVWDPYANGKALVLLSNNALASVGFGYLVTMHYTQTGLPDLAPAAPANLSGFVALSGANYEVRLKYADTASNEFWVEAERCTGSGCTDFSKVAQSLGEDATGLADKNVARGVTYTCRVRALGFMGHSDASNTIEVTVPGASLPAAPTNLTAAMSGANVVLNWQDNSTNETQFGIERCQGAGCTTFAFYGSTGPNVTTWTDGGAASGQTYLYRVRAGNADGYSDYSNIATIVTAGGQPTVPAAPSNLSAQALNKSQIKLAWTNNSGRQDGVKIERCKGSICANFVQIATVAGTATTFTDSGLAANTSYRYRTRAYNSAGDSPYSNSATAKTPRK